MPKPTDPLNLKIGQPIRIVNRRASFVPIVSNRGTFALIPVGSGDSERRAHAIALAMELAQEAATWRCECDNAPDGESGDVVCFGCHARAALEGRTAR